MAVLPYLPPVTPPTAIYDAVAVLVNVGLGLYLASKVRDATKAVPTDVATTCTNCKKEPERCPVCGILPNPTPNRTPAYLNPPRVPKDSETMPPLTVFKRTTLRVKGATVFELPDGTYRHRDTLHVGKAAEIETYSRQGQHTGAVCPQCGAFKPGSIDPKKRLYL